jgi:phenylpropionate dioxygenase-like ring-hydroxylating dioxygenase large terminal subunit
MVTAPQPDAVQPAQAATKENPDRFHWRTCWYPIAFVVDLPENAPYGFSIFGEPLVLFRDGSGTLICVLDRCPHRLAKLSDGQVLEGRLECLYHGWQFGSGGECLHIPQLLAEATIPQRARVQSFPVRECQGIVWVWADAEVAPDPAVPPVVAEIDQRGVFKVDTATDFPFDHAVLVENLLDPAHVYISHDRTEMGIRREDARPLTLEVLSTSAAGISGRFRRADNANAPWTSLNFHAPVLVHYSFSNPAYGVVGGLALYALPVAYGRSRILVRRYGNIFKRRFRLKPRWLEHLRQNKILEEDLAFLLEQDRFFRKNAASTQATYFPLKTCDTLVMEHRRWLDRFGDGLPWYVGFASRKAPSPTGTDGETCEGVDDLALETRYERHTHHCQACRGTHQRLVQLKQGAQGVAVLGLALALVSQGWWRAGFVGLWVGAMATITAADRLKGRFE